jgi:hypothetical protein
MFFKRMVCALLIVSMFTACTTITRSGANSSASRGGTSDSSTYEQEDGKGFDNFWTIVAGGLAMALAYLGASVMVKEQKQGSSSR